MSIDLTLNRGPYGASVPADADGRDPAAGSTEGPRASDFSPGDIAKLRAARNQYLQRLMADRMTDGVDGAATPKTTPQNKLTANPYALSPETLRKVATDAKAGPALPPPAAHVRPPTTAQMQAFAKRFAMHGPAGATIGAAGAAITPEAVQQAIAHYATTTETLTPEEASYVKQLVGRAPPAAVVAATTDGAPKASSGAAIPGTVKNSDSIETLKAAATTFISWNRFYILLTQKQQATLALWLTQRHKLQLLANSISISMLQAQKQLQINEISLQQVNMSLGFIRAIESAKNSWTIGMMRPLKNAGLNVMRSAADLGTGNNQNEDRAPAQDLHRMAFIRRAVQGEAAVSQTPFKHYLANTEGQGTLNAQGTDSLRVPPKGQAAGDPSTWQQIPRSLLSDEEVDRLPPGLKAAYTQAFNEMIQQRQSDYGSMVGLFSHERDLCRSAADRWQSIADNATSTADRTAALANRDVWQRRADNIYAKGQPWRERMQHRSAMVMCDENRYGDLMRERVGFEAKRRELKQQLAPGAPELSADQRAHLERVKMNIDWRAMALDRELARHSNPVEDIRLRRWHTGAASMADGFYLAHLQRQGPDKAPAPVPTDVNLRWQTMSDLAPTGAAKLNENYIKLVERFQERADSPERAKVPALAPEDLAGVTRVQMLRHIEDRRDALATYGDRLTDDPKVRAFHDVERRHLDAVESYVRTEAPFTDRARAPSIVPKALQIKPLGPTNATMWRLGRQSQNIKVDTTPHDAPEGNGAAASSAKPDALDEQARRNYYDAKASAGAAIMGEHKIPGTAAYQNGFFERTNATLGDISQFISFDALESAAFEAADSSTEAVAGDAAAKLSEVYSEMAQERRIVEPMMPMFIDDALKVST